MVTVPASQVSQSAQAATQHTQTRRRAQQNLFTVREAGRLRSRCLQMTASDCSREADTELESR